VRPRPGGITILDGPPGTGKSTLITQLMRRLADTHVFYVLPVGQHSTLSRPELVTFWQEQNTLHPKHVKVVVMEDAEKILLQRRTDNNEPSPRCSTSADGLMGQMLRVHVLCPLNQDMDQIDPAILRPGRLRGYRHVGLLTRETAVRLAVNQKLPFVPDPLREFYTLAEVFHGKVYKTKVPRRLGFTCSATNPAMAAECAPPSQAPFQWPRMQSSSSTGTPVPAFKPDLTGASPAAATHFSGPEY